MTSWVWASLGAFILGALVNEFSDLCPWIARGVVRWAARRWTSDSELALSYAEEWAAVIDSRPGKLFKLFTATGFAIGAIWRWQRHSTSRGMRLRAAFPVDRVLSGTMNVVSILGVLVVMAAVVQAAVDVTSSEIITAAVTVMLLIGLAVLIDRQQVLSGSLPVRINYALPAILLCVVLLPTSLAVLATFVGSVFALLLMRRASRRLLFPVARVTIVTLVGSIIIAALGAPSSVGDLALAFGAMVVVDELIRYPSHALLHATLCGVVSGVAHLGPAVLVGVIVKLRPELLFAVMPLLLATYALGRAKFKAQTERVAWQRLCDAALAMRTHNLEEVLRAAVRHGTSLLPVDAVEVEVWFELLARGNDREIYYLGRPDSGVYDPSTTAIFPLAVDADDRRIGELRLTMRRPGKLSERDHQILLAFTAALATSVSNALAFERLLRLPNRFEAEEPSIVEVRSQPLDLFAASRRRSDSEAWNEA